MISSFTHSLYVKCFHLLSNQKGPKVTKKLESVLLKANLLKYNWFYSRQKQLLFPVIANFLLFCYNNHVGGIFQGSKKGDISAF
jgi:hypothetical protein